jgi:hypothetical protein
MVTATDACFQRRDHLVDREPLDQAAQPAAFLDPLP